MVFVVRTKTSFLFFSGILEERMGVSSFERERRAKTEILYSSTPTMFLVTEEFNASD